MSKRSEAKRKPCLQCNKSLLKAQWYYRDSGYFCNKNCYKEYTKKKEAGKAS